MAETPVNLYIVMEALLDVGTQVLMLFASWVDWMFTEHLLLGNIVSAALLLGLADFSIQTLELFVQGTRTDYDKTRNYRSMQVGMVLGVFNHLWYAFLESYLQGNGLSVVFKKIAFDQAIAGPFFSSAFLVGMGLLEGKSAQEVYEEWNQKFIHIYMVDWMFWPLAQFINFHMVPYRFRVFYVNFATFLWNTFLSYAKHCSDQIRKHQISRYIDQQRSPEHEAGSNKTRSNASRSPSKPRLQRNRGSCTSVKLRPTSSKFRFKRNSSCAGHGMTTIKQPLQPVCDRSSTVSSIFSIKKLLPVFGSSPIHSESETGVKELPEASWITEDCTNHAASCMDSSSTSEGSYNLSLGTTPTIATITKATTSAPEKPISARRGNTTTIRGVGMFAEGNVKKPPCFQNMPVRRKMEHRPSQSMRCGISTEGKLPSKPQTALVAGGNLPKRLYVPVPQSRAAVGSTTGSPRGNPTTRPVRTTVPTLEELRAALQELKDLVAKGQKELKDELADTQAQVSRLQELCAVTYVSVDDGTRDLAHKADQLASWVQMERKLEVGQIRTTMEEVLAAKKF